MIHLLFTALFVFANDDLVQRAEEALAAAEKRALPAHETYTPKVRSTPGGAVVTFSRTWNDLPVWENKLRRANFDRNRKVTSLTPIAPLQPSGAFSINPEHAASAAQTWLERQEKPTSVTISAGDTVKGIFNYGSQVRQSFRVRAFVQQKNNMKEPFHVYVDAQSGRVLQKEQIIFNFQTEEDEEPTYDATGVGTAYRTSPAALSLDADFDSATARQDALMEVQLENLDGSGYLRGAYVNVAPLVENYNQLRLSPRVGYKPGTAFSEEGTYHYEPGHAGFGEVNVYFWVDNTQRYLQSLNIQAFDRPINIYVHSFDGHNAYFDTHDEEIHFGDAVNPSAYDVSVVLHEYGHALLHDVAGDALRSGVERSTLHEGFADYIAYALEQSVGRDFGLDLHPEFMGEYLGLMFGGHPPFVRTLIEPPFDYPNRTESNGHRNGELWSSAFYELDHIMGRDAFVTLLFEALVRMPSYNEPVDLVAAFTEADLVLNESTNSETLASVFGKRKFDQPNELTATLNVGESILLSEGRSLITINPGDPAQPFTISWGSNYMKASLYQSIDADHYPVLVYQTSFDNNIPVAAMGTLPSLQGGTYFTLEVSTADPGTTLSIIPGATPQPSSVLPENQTYTPDYEESISLQSEVPFDAILLWVTGELGNQITLHTSSNAPLTSGTGRSGIISSYLSIDPKVPNYIRISGGQPLHKAFMIFPSGRPESIRWRAIRTDEVPRLVPSLDGAEVTADADGILLLQGRYGPLLSNGDLVISSDANTPFLMYRRSGTNFFSSVVDGVHQFTFSNYTKNLILDGKTYGYDTESHDDYIIIGFAEPGTTTKFKLLYPPPNRITEMTVDQPQTFTLQPNELHGYRWNNLNPIHSGLVFQIQPDAGHPDLQYAMLDNFGWPLFNDHKSFKVREGQTQVRIEYNFSPVYRNSPYLNETIVWIRNHGDEAATFEVDLSFHNEQQTVTTLADTGPQPLVWAMHGSNEYWSKHTLPIHSTDKRIAINFAPDNGSENMQMLVKMENSNSIEYRAFDQGYIQLGVFDFGNLQSENITSLNLLFRSTDADNLPDNVVFNVERFTTNESLTLDQSGQVEQQLSPSARDLLRIEPQMPIRGLQVRYNTETLSDNAYLDATLTRDTLVQDLALEYSSFSKNYSRELIHLSDAPLLPLPDTTFFLDQQLADFSTAASSNDLGIPINAAKPVDLDAEVRLLPLTTDTQLPPSATPAQSTIDIREVMAINPTTEPITVTWGSQSFTLAPGGFHQANLAPDATLDLKGSGPLAIFERMSGEAWETLTAPSPFKAHQLTLPHVPPASSAWETIATLSHAGEAEATVYVAANYQNTDVSPGIGNYTLPKAIPGSLAILETSISPIDDFRELAISGTQYWTLDGHFAAEKAGVAAGKVLHVPHFPKVADWWVGMTLANASFSEIRVTIAPYSSEGLMFDQVRHVTLPGNESVTGLLETFIDAEAVNDVQWMRIHSEEGAFTGLCFIGTWQDGDDVAAFSLPNRTATDLIFPGPNQENWYGIAVTNTVNATGNVLVQAVGSDGSVLASFEETLAPNQKVLFTGTETFPDLGPGDYYIRVSADDIRISGLVVGGNGGKALSAQTPILLP